MSFKKLDGDPWKLEFVGKGRSGLVLRWDDKRVIKVPRIYENDDAPPAQPNDGNAEGNILSLENEKQTMERLGHHADIVEWYELRQEGIVMKLMKNGPLHEYRSKIQLSPRRMYDWISKIGQGIAHCHSQMVIICDVSSRNVLIDEYECAKICDFTEAAILPLDTLDIAQESPDGFSVQTDIFEFGRVIYEIVTGKIYEYDIFFPDKQEFERQYYERIAREETDHDRVPETHTDSEDTAAIARTETDHDDIHNDIHDEIKSAGGSDDDNPGTSNHLSPTTGLVAAWPNVSQLPSVERLPFGDVIYKCWTKQYRDMRTVLEDIRKNWERIGSDAGGNIQ